VIAFITHSASKTVQESPYGWQIVLYVSIGALVLVIIRLLIPYLWSKVRKSSSNKIDTNTDIPVQNSTIPIIGNPKIVASGIYFYENRKQTGGMLEMFADTSECDALWFSGFGASNYISTALKGKFKRLILVNPNFGIRNQEIQYFLANVWHKTPDFYFNFVKDFSDQAVKEGIKVYWLNEIPKYGIAISNHRSDKAWIKIEKSEFRDEIPNWPSMIIYHDKQEMLYNAFYSLYEEVLSKAQEYPQCLEYKPNQILTKEQQDLLNFYEQQKLDWERYIKLKITNVISYTKATTPYLVFQFKVCNFLPVSFKIIRINAGGTLNSGKLGNLPSLKESIEQQFQPCGDGEFNLKLEINGTGLPTMLEDAVGKSVQWIIQGEWRIEIYGETRLWRNASSLVFSQIPQLVAGN